MMQLPAAPRRLTVASGSVRLAALLYLPACRPLGALLVCHGAGSRKENHAVMGEQAAAAGLAALVFDFRGHGESDGAMDAGAGDDVVATAEALRAAAPAVRLTARGSSLGAYWLLSVAQRQPQLFDALALLCPADEASLLRGLDRFAAHAARPSHPGDRPADRPADGDEPASRFDVPALRALWRSTDVTASAAGTARVLLAHARDDPDVPFSVSERLFRTLAPPKRFIALAQGGHKGPQRSARVAQTTIRWALEGAGRRPPSDR